LIRKLAVDTLARRARDLVAVELLRKADGSLDLRRVRRDEADDLADFLCELERQRQQPKRGTRLPEEHLREVADVYGRAQAEQKPPTKTVAVGFGTSQPNTSHWVREARRRGFLEPALAGRGGERPGEEQDG
jgi:hypothetical protein